MKIPRKNKSREVKINTTALPDIIFMLLFFFMVTTVIQNENLSHVELPNVESYNAKPSSKPNELHIFLGSENGIETLKIESRSYPFNKLSSIFTKEFSKIKSQGKMIDRAILWIDAATPMSNVNKIKSELQNHHILKVEYIHNQKPSSN